MSLFFRHGLKSDFNKVLWLMAAAALAPLPAGAESATRARFLMGTVCEVTAHGKDASRAIDAAFGEIARLDRVMSLFKDDSELSALNRRAPFQPAPTSPDLFRVLHVAHEVYRFSGGAYDPTAESGRPSAGYERVRLDPDRRAVELLAPNVRIDLNGIGKGYALDEAARALRERGIRDALLNFGGQVLAVGRQPGSAHWTVELAGAPASLLLADRSAATSSQEEHPDHLVAPRTGKPIRRRGSVTVVAADATRADAWSTALFVLGVGRAPREFRGCAIETRDGKIVAKTGWCGEYLRPHPHPLPPKAGEGNKEKQQ